MDTITKQFSPHDSELCALLTKCGYDVSGPIVKRVGDLATKNNEYVFTVSTNDLDRDHEIVSQSAYKLKPFLSNPVILYNHDSSRFPVGKAVRLRAEDTALTGAITFASDIHEGAAVVQKLVDGGYLNAVSVGMSNVQVTVQEEKGVVYGLYTSAELIEISIVGVPANRKALRHGVTEIPLEDLRTRDLSEEEIKQVISMLE